MPFPNGKNVRSKDLNKSGGWFPSFVHYLLGGELLGTQYEADLVISERELDCEVEIKAGGSTNGFLIPISQLNEHGDKRTFSIPPTESFYALLGYNNKDANDMSGSLLKRIPPSKLDVFFAKHTTCLYLLDLSVVTALRRSMNGSACLIRNDSTWVLKRKMLREYFNAARGREIIPEKTLKALKLSPRRFSISDYWVATRYREKQMFFRATFVLQKQHLQFFEERIRSRAGYCEPWIAQRRMYQGKLAA